MIHRRQRFITFAWYISLVSGLLALFTFLTGKTNLGDVYTSVTTYTSSSGLSEAIDSLLARLGNSGPATSSASPNELATNNSSQSILFDVGMAMTLLYGAWSPVSQRGLWVSTGTETDGFPNGQRMSSRVIGQFTFREAARDKVLLIAYNGRDGEEGADCHACSPCIGGVQLAKERGIWVVEALSRKISCRVGSFGTPPDSQDLTLVRMGTEQFGLSLEVGESYMGDVVGAVSYFARKKKKIVEVIRIQTQQTSTGSPAFGIKKCDSNWEVTFLPNVHQGFYDLQVKPLKDPRTTWCEGEDDRVRKYVMSSDVYRSSETGSTSEEEH